MLKTVLVVGIIQIACALIMTVLCSISSKKYSSVVNVGMEMSTTLNHLITSLETINNNIMNNDYNSQIPGYELNCVEGNVQTLNNDTLYSYFYKLKDEYNSYCSNYKQLITQNNYGLSNTDIKTKEKMLNSFDNIKSYANEMAENTVAANQETLLLGIQYLSWIKWLSILIVITVLMAVVICTISIRSTGKQMEHSLEKEKIKANQNFLKASTDALTGLWNREYTEKAVEKIIKHDHTGCLFMFDMDNFKKVNDTYGHIAGDNILKAFALVLRKTFRESDIPCRIGGDEFILFANHIPIARAKDLGQAVIDNMVKEMHDIDGGTVVSVSIGIAMVKEDIKTFKELYDKADSALYIVKNNGKNSYFLKD